MTWSERFQRIDNLVLGRPVPDSRPFRQRLLSPRPAVESGRAKVLYGLIVVGMLVMADQGFESWPWGLLFVALVAAGFLVSAADQRRLARRRHRHEDEH
ncbi:MAG: hypothetical protein JWN87_2364 [Frankiales bacterium]|nr:hypothetical protein [Frankiales bacterium]